jgi:hypothetical protein
MCRSNGQARRLLGEPRMHRFVLAIVCGGCVAGGGPFIGITDSNKIVYGVEAGGGSVLQGNLGWQNRGNTLYLHVDAAVDIAGVASGDPTQRNSPFGGRIGAGGAIRFDDDTLHGMALAGPSAGRVIGGYVSDCSGANNVFLMYLEIRKVGGERQIVIAPRYERQFNFCLGF